MFPLLLFLILLIVTTPAFIIFDGPIVHGFVALVAALSVGTVAWCIRAGDARFLTTVIRPVAIVALVPAVWMLIQLLPLNTGLAHPIWESAAAALRKPIAGSISIDPGDTLVSLVRYLSVAAIAIWAASVAVDRWRAEWILIALTLAASLIALMVLSARLTGLAVFDNSGPAGPAATDCASLGVVVAATAAFHMYERGKTQPLERNLAFWHRLTFAACLIATAICGMAVIVAATSQSYFAIACGIATLVVAAVTRRFSFGPWGYSAIISVALVVAIGAVALRSGTRTPDLTLAFAARAPASLIAVTQRALMEVSWTGTGAGTFAAILPIYRDIDELVLGSAAPTGAAAIAIEMGRPFFWAVFLAALALVVTLLRGALLRRRDSFYSAAGAGCVVTGMLLLFGNSGLFSTPAVIITAAVIGIALAQSKSRLN